MKWLFGLLLCLTISSFAGGYVYEEPLSPDVSKQEESNQPSSVMKIKHFKKSKDPRLETAWMYTIAGAIGTVIALFVQYYYFGVSALIVIFGGMFLVGLLKLLTYRKPTNRL